MPLSEARDRSRIVTFPQATACLSAALILSVTLARAAPRRLEPKAKPVSGAARRGGASSASAIRYGEFTFSADEVTGKAVRTPAFRGLQFTLEGSARFQGPDSTITARMMRIDVAGSVNDIVMATATGDVVLVNRAPAGTMEARGQSLVFNRARGRIEMGGGVIVERRSKDAGDIRATGKSAVVTANPNRLSDFQHGAAVLTGGVRMTIVKPDTFDGPFESSGQTLTVNLGDLTWKFSGKTEGTFRLKSDAPGGASKAGTE